MFRPKATVGGPGQAPETPGEQPGKSPASRPRAAHESRIFQPSTFASRRAEAASPAGPRLVYLGTSEHRQEDWKTGKTEVLTVELYADADHPARQWYRVPGSTLQPLFDDQRREEVTPLGTFPRTPRGLAPRTFPEAVPEPPPRPVA